MSFKPPNRKEPQEMTREEMIQEIKSQRAETDMLYNAWLRELGGKIFNKSHLIDALVITTRWLRKRSDEFGVLDTKRKHAEMEAEYGPHIDSIRAYRDQQKHLKELPCD